MPWLKLTKFYDRGGEALINDTSASPSSPLYFLQHCKNKKWKYYINKRPSFE